MSAADPTAAIASYLKEHIGDLVEGRVFRPTLPETEDAAMPRAAIVVRPAPGGNMMTGKGTLPLADPVLTVVCYGATPLEAQNVAREAALTLKAMVAHVRHGTLLKWARIAGGPTPVIDPDTAWPYAALSVQVLHGESAI